MTIGCACSVSADIPQVNIQGEKPGCSSKEQMDRALFSVWEFWATFQEISFSLEILEGQVSLSNSIPPEIFGFIWGKWQTAYILAILKVIIRKPGHFPNSVVLVEALEFSLAALYQNLTLP